MEKECLKTNGLNENPHLYHSSIKKNHSESVPKLPLYTD